VESAMSKLQYLYLPTHASYMYALLPV